MVKTFKALFDGDKNMKDSRHDLIFSWIMFFVY